MRRLAPFAVLPAVLALAACAVAPPTGPSVMALPGKGKDFVQFQQDDGVCRQFAAQRIGYGSPAVAANQSAVNSAAVGTVLGAAAGAALGAAAGNPGAGAAIGAGSGLLVGGASGANAAQLSAGALQQQYDMAYVQCMYAKGDTVVPSVVGSADPYAYYPYGPYGYPAYPAYGYGYPAPYYGSATIGFGWGHGWDHDGWHHWR